MKLFKALALLIAMYGLTMTATAQTTSYNTTKQHITPEEARNHIGEVSTVCGKVASLHWATKTKGEPTFINLDRAYPNQIFTILIWGNDRPRFGNLEQDYMDKPLCVTGAISSYRGVPEIITRSPGSIKLGQ